MSTILLLAILCHEPVAEVQLPICEVVLSPVVKKESPKRAEKITVDSLREQIMGCRCGPGCNCGKQGNCDCVSRQTVIYQPPPRQVFFRQRPQVGGGC